MFFRCLKLHFNNNKQVKDYFRMWLKYNNRTIDETQFPGIIDIEKCFNIKILIYIIVQDM